MESAEPRAKTKAELREEAKNAAHSTGLIELKARRKRRARARAKRGWLPYAKR